MSGCLDLLDRAFEIGERELDLLAEGEVDGAQELASERNRLLTTASASFGEEDKGAVLERLNRIKALQGHITAEARRLHQELQAELGRTKKESKRLAGYSGAARPSPRIRNQYINRQG
jgi:hypothetical protein